MSQQPGGAGHPLRQVGVERERQAVSARRAMQRGEPGVECQPRGVENLPDLELVRVRGGDRPRPWSTLRLGRARRRRAGGLDGQDPPRLAPVRLVDHPAVEHGDALTVRERVLDCLRLRALGTPWDGGRSR